MEDAASVPRTWKRRHSVSKPAKIYPCWMASRSGQLNAAKCSLQNAKFTGPYASSNCHPFHTIRLRHSAPWRHASLLPLGPMDHLGTKQPLEMRRLGQLGQLAQQKPVQQRLVGRPIRREQEQALELAQAWAARMAGAAEQAAGAAAGSTDCGASLGSPVAAARAERWRLGASDAHTWPAQCRPCSSRSCDNTCHWQHWAAASLAPHQLATESTWQWSHWRDGCPLHQFHAPSAWQARRRTRSSLRQWRDPEKYKHEPTPKPMKIVTRGNL